MRVPAVMQCPRCSCLNVRFTFPLPSRRNVVRGTWVAAGRKAAKKQRKASKSPPLTPQQLKRQVEMDVESIDMVLPPTAPPTSDYRQEVSDDLAPQDIYPVFRQAQRERWSWEDEEASEELKAAWNPRTGFSNADVDPPYQPQVDLTGFSSTAEGELPLVTKNQVIQAAFSTAASFVVIAILIRGYAGQNSPLALSADPALFKQLTAFPGPVPGVAELAALVTAIASVTAGRAFLLESWPSFAEASNRSNKQVLTPLSTLDIVFVSCLAGFSEELLFRGALIPATLPDWRGAILAAVVFGALHTNGGRNVSFAAWAGAVGLLYGFLFLYTKNVLVAGVAHSVANMASAWLWWTKYRVTDTDSSK